MKSQKIPLISFVYFIMAMLWLIGAVVAYGEMFFLLFLLLAGLNVFIGLRIIRQNKKQES
ncbi:hypothetical protein M3212_10640 [Alkalihalobacillus oceani]|uniref:hypothetical protein n=1 Tax=Halalkalibacter oceani TaxID=1653776 RepID=UPI00204148CB|nr:hypothetical protein [Halalkalibacter oceani]MCM3761238.1 hypothetical protein [Halalkalibacter oceani]